MTKIADSVALVVDRRYGPKLAELERRSHVWACKSVDNSPAAELIRSGSKERRHGLGITVFDAPDNGTAESICWEVLPTLCEHHSGWKVIDVHGASLSPLLRRAFAQAGANRCEETDFGFRCIREKV